MGKSHKAKASPKTIAKTTGLQLNETQLDQASGGIIVVCRKPPGLVPAV